MNTINEVLFAMQRDWLNSIIESQKWYKSTRNVCEKRNTHLGFCHWLTRNVKDPSLHIDVKSLLFKRSRVLEYLEGNYWFPTVSGHLSGTHGSSGAELTKLECLTERLKVITKSILYLD